ncbi:MAG: 50S ribosomal protein L13 [Betaproteobacteria bacterium]|nr:50S ribosomal protein L13 [Betaproteobacteria bacterium]
MNRTSFPNDKAVGAERKWLLVDANGQTLGRLASRVALVLRGKHKSCWSPHTDAGDNVIVINAGRVAVTGNKEKDKKYYRHSGYPGGIKETSLAHLRKRHPERIIEKAVRGMLPKGPLGSRMLKKLHVYPGADHKHEAQTPQPFDPSVRSAI